MRVITENQDPSILQINEMMVRDYDHLPTEIEHSIFYTKLKKLLHQEIISFCREQTELKEDLNLFRMSVGQPSTEAEIREYLDSLKAKYNGVVQNIGIDYAIEITRIDYFVVVFCVIKRADIHMKQFTFRFRKNNLSQGLSNLSVGQIPLTSLTDPNTELGKGRK